MAELNSPHDVSTSPILGLEPGLIRGINLGSWTSQCSAFETALQKFHHIDAVLVTFPIGSRSGLLDINVVESAVRREQKPPTEIHQAGKLPTANNPAEHHVLATYKHNWHLVTKGMHPDGESGRSGIHPIHFCRVAWQSTSTASTFVNVLWPFVPAAIVLHFARPDLHVWMLAINYIAMVPAANLLGFAEQELARKLPKVGGILFETALGSVVEIVLFLMLIEKDNETGDVSTPEDLIPVIQAVILGSILTNLLLCLGLCFFVGGLKRKEQVFHTTISEAGSGLLLVAGFALIIASAFFSALAGVTVPAGSEEG